MLGALPHLACQQRPCHAVAATRHGSAASRGTVRLTQASAVLFASAPYLLCVASTPAATRPAIPGRTPMFSGDWRWRSRCQAGRADCRGDCRSQTLCNCLAAHTVRARAQAPKKWRRSRQIPSLERTPKIRPLRSGGHQTHCIIQSTTIALDGCNTGLATAPCLDTA